MVAEFAALFLVNYETLPNEATPKPDKFHLHLSRTVSYKEKIRQLLSD
jgi:hypothetical protein